MSDDERESDPARRNYLGFSPVLLGYLLDYILGIVLGCLAVAGFVWIAIIVARGELLPLDVAGIRWAQSAQSPRTTAAALEITALGSVPVILLVLFLATLFLPAWSSGGRMRGTIAGRGADHTAVDRCGLERDGLRSDGQVLLLWLATIGGVVLNTLLKSHFSRPRPSLTPAVIATSFAFPSGHSMMSLIVYGTLAYLVVRGAPYRTTLHILSILGSALVIISIGLSRIFLGVHYATDVLGGYLAGFTWAAFCILAYEIGRVRRTRRPEEETTR